MLNTIIDALKNQSIEHYIIKETKKETAELFFIKKRLDMRRMKETDIFEVTVYRDFTDGGKEMRGASRAYISASTEPDEVSRALAEAYEAAGNAKNPAFELYRGDEKTDCRGGENNGGCAASCADTAMRMSAALFSEDVRGDAFINSAEIFAENREVNILTSEGVKAAYVKHRCTGEFVVQCKAPADVEQYFSFEYESADEGALRAKVRSALDTVCDRAKAQKKPVGGKYNVVLSGENLKELLKYYVARSSASAVYAKYSDFTTGTAVQGDGVTGEVLNLDVLPAAPYSDEGIPMGERTLVKDGKLCFLHGDTRFCRYLGIEPTGSYRRVRLNGGTVPFDEMKKGCLYPVSFSDFQMDAMSGHFGGEIRLAYYYTDKGVELLCGGSVNGNFIQAQKSMTFSVEQYTDSAYTGPLAVRLEDVSVSGE